MLIHKSQQFAVACILLVLFACSACSSLPDENGYVVYCPCMGIYLAISRSLEVASFKL